MSATQGLWCSSVWWMCRLWCSQRMVGFAVSMRMFSVCVFVCLLQPAANSRRAGLCSSVPAPWIWTLHATRHQPHSSPPPQPNTTGTLNRESTQLVLHPGQQGPVPLGILSNVGADDPTAAGVWSGGARAFQQALQAEEQEPVLGDRRACALVMLRLSQLQLIAQPLAPLTELLKSFGVGLSDAVAVLGSSSRAMIIPEPQLSFSLQLLEAVRAARCQAPDASQLRALLLQLQGPEDAVQAWRNQQLQPAADKQSVEETAGMSDAPPVAAGTSSTPLPASTSPLPQQQQQQQQQQQADVNGSDQTAAAAAGQACDPPPITAALICFGEQQLGSSRGRQWVRPLLLGVAAPPSAAAAAAAAQHVPIPASVP